MAPIETVERIAAGTGLPAVARRMDISEIGAARALQDVAGHRRHVADLRGGAGEYCFRQHREPIAHNRVPRQLAVGNTGARGDPLVRYLDARQPEMPTSMTVSGVSTSTFIRSISVVPPARNIAPGRLPTALAASVARANRSNVKVFMTVRLPSRPARFVQEHLPHGRHDVRIGGTATQVAAHPLADLLVGHCRAGDRLSNVPGNVAGHTRVHLLHRTDGREDLSGWVSMRLLHLYDTPHHSR